MTAKNNNMAAWAIIAIIALVGLNGYQWFINSQLKTQKIRQETELIELEKIQAELDKDYEAALESLEESKSDNRQLNELVESQKNELKSQKDKINDLIWTKRELSKAKDEIANLSAQTAQFITELSKLKEENQVLASTNVTLRQENVTLNTQVAETQKANQELEETKKVLAQEREKLTKVNEELDVKVDMANAIKINFMQVQGYRLNDKGERKKKSKAKDIDVIDVCFTTETNMVTPAGAKDFQIRLISPSGETVAREDMGSGILTNKLDNTQVKYTTSGSIDYQNQDTNGCIEWKLSEKLSKGLYDVEIYNNGFMVGKGTYQMK